MEQVSLNVQGMSCQGCVGSVTRVLRATAGVSDARVSLTPGKAEVTYDPARTDPSALRKAVEDAGYDAL